MEFEDCVTSDEKNVCKQLLRSLPNFQPYPHERMIRLALSPPLFVSLNLTIQHGPCAFNCEGGNVHNCNITKEDHFWTDASYPYYFNNCAPSHNYCVAASIGDCCPVCTSTVFMTDFHQENFHEDRWQWNSELIIIIVLTIILFSLGFVIFLKTIFNKGLKSRRQKSQDIINNPLTQHILEIDENNQPKIQVVCLYLREHNPLFLNMVNSVLEFLRGNGIIVIDIYNEEENINRSVARWVKTVIQEENTKILLFDTVNTRQLWNGTMDSNKILKPLEQVIHFTRSSIPVSNVHNYLFVVRFQGMDFDTKTFIDLSDGRCYVYPIHRERLANDLKI